MQENKKSLRVVQPETNGQVNTISIRVGFSGGPPTMMTESASAGVVDATAAPSYTDGRSLDTERRRPSPLLRHQPPSDVIAGRQPPQHRDARAYTVV